MPTGEKWIVYEGDAYYPQAYEFDDETRARRHWEKLKEDRKKDRPDFVDADYLAKVIEQRGIGETCGEPR